MASRKVARGHSSIGTPSMRSCPGPAWIKRGMRRAKVVLPEPTRPIIPRVVPWGNFEIDLMQNLLLAVGEIELAEGDVSGDWARR